MHFTFMGKYLEGYTCPFDSDYVCRVLLQRIFTLYAFLYGHLFTTNVFVFNNICCTYT